MMVQLDVSLTPAYEKRAVCKSVLPQAGICRGKAGNDSSIPKLAKQTNKQTPQTTRNSLDQSHLYLNKRRLQSYLEADSVVSFSQDPLTLLPHHCHS